MLRQFQIISWFPKWFGFRVIRFDPIKTDLARIYNWFLVVGFFEIRKWRIPRPKNDRS